jgi:uncharacterized DUF497 family protein
MKKIVFEWDENKNRSNIKKHGISFEEAQTVFYDENATEFFDEDHSEKEERFILLGLSHKIRVLIVCHCLREEDVIRIISARKATKKEQRNYTGGIQ